MQPSTTDTTEGMLLSFASKRRYPCLFLGTDLQRRFILAYNISGIQYLYVGLNMSGELDQYLAKYGTPEAPRTYQVDLPLPAVGAGLDWYKYVVDHIILPLDPAGQEEFISVEDPNINYQVRLKGESEWTWVLGSNLTPLWKETVPLDFRGFKYFDKPNQAPAPAPVPLSLSMQNLIADLKAARTWDNSTGVDKLISEAEANEFDRSSRKYDSPQSALLMRLQALGLTALVRKVMAGCYE